MISIQIVALAIVSVFLFAIVAMVRSGTLRAKYSFLWLTVGASLLVFGAAPPLMESAARTIGIFYPPAMLFFGSIMLLLFVAVHFSWELSRLEERTRTLTEELALANARIFEIECGVDSIHRSVGASAGREPGSPTVTRA